MAQSTQEQRPSTGSQDPNVSQSNKTLAAENSASNSQLSLIHPEEQTSAKSSRIHWYSIVKVLTAGAFFLMIGFLFGSITLFFITPGGVLGILTGILGAALVSLLGPWLLNKVGAYFLGEKFKVPRFITPFMMGCAYLLLFFGVPVIPLLSFLAHPAWLSLYTAVTPFLAILWFATRTIEATTQVGEKLSDLRKGLKEIQQTLKDTSTAPPHSAETHISETVREKILPKVMEDIKKLQKPNNDVTPTEQRQN